MAKSGSKSRVGAPSASAPSTTREALVEAAIATLRTEGFGGASARTIARTAGCNQALVFYHFGSVCNLLLAALDRTSERRMARYTEALAGTDGLEDLLEVAGAVFREDLDSGHAAVLAQMIAGCASTPGLGAEVAARVAPWIEFSERATARALGDTSLAGLLPTKDIAYAIVALYLGIEFLADLDGERGPAESLFASAQGLSGLLGALLAPRSRSEGDVTR
jgi:AcrR family transcriptional regulator